MRFQLAVGHDMRCEWIDDGNAAGCHDLRCLWRSNFHEPFRNVNVLADNGYINPFYPVNMVTGYKKPRNGELDRLQQEYNASHGTARSPVERYIGIYKSRFDMAMHGYHGPLRHFLRLVKLGIVFTNDIIRICQNHFTEAEEDIINDTIRTDVHTNPLPEFLLVNNSLIETMIRSSRQPTNRRTCNILGWNGRAETLGRSHTPRSVPCIFRATPTK